MIIDRTRGVYNLCLLCNLTVVVVVYWCWVLVYNDRLPLTASPARDYFFCLEFMLLGLVLGFRAKKYDNDAINPPWRIANNRSLRQTAAALFAGFVVINAFRVPAIEPMFLFSFGPILYLTLLPGNRYLPRMISQRLFRGSREERIVVVGSAARAGGLRSWLENKELVGFRTLGIVSDDPLATTGSGYRFLGGTSDLGRVLAELRVTQAILAEIPGQAKVLQSCIQICEKAAVRMLAVSDIEERFQHTVTFFEDDGRRFIALRDEPLEDPLNRALKRALDVAISLPVTLFLLPPVTLAVWFLQRLQSPGPVFFVQWRAGMQNRDFRILKYRTMHPGREDEAKQATRSDERTYPAGRWLRKFSVDELPQFFNVLTGKMSVVGPRPHLSRHNEIFAKALNNFHVRANVRPGITGLAQVRGYRGEIREDSDIIERVKADIHYLEQWSFGLDCYVILQTVKQVILPPERAY